MKTADLYIRVSTDEQADKGYSQRDQEERLRKYCELNTIQIRHVIFEDHSAKTFERPKWKQLLNSLRKNKFQSDLIIFTKWDRFSRNAGDAYGMINLLRSLGVEPQAVEQPLDLSIPENKMMLAFYLAAPEVENDRRSLNILYGMRRARKEGRWVSTAPLGYKNCKDNDGKKTIIPVEPTASIIKFAFTSLAEGSLVADHVRKLMNKKGLTCSRSNFWRTIRNPVYCGKIFLPKFKDDDSQIIQGIHQPLISETLFYKVQDILDGNKRKTRVRTTVTSDDFLPLRGFLLCPRCNRMLTGSGSKGRNRIHYYYHCLASCGCRFSADLVNNSFLEELKKLIMKPAIVPLFKSVIKMIYEQKQAGSTSDIKNITVEMKKIEERITKGRELLLEGDIDRLDYKKIKEQGEEKLRRLEADMSDAMEQQKKKVNIDALLDSTVNTITRLGDIYNQASVEKKKEMVGSIYAEKLCFDGNKYRTTNMNEVISLIHLMNNELNVMKNEKEKSENFLSRLVERTGIEPVIPP